LRARRALAGVPLLALLAGTQAGARELELRAGYGSAELETPLGAPLAGYGGLWDRRAEGTLDPPRAIAVVLEQGTLRVALLSLDIVIARPSLREALLARTADLELDLLSLVATHTHSGPGGYLPGWLAERVTGGTHDPDVVPALTSRAEQALRSAVADLAPARLSSGTAALDLARNRRRADGPRETELPLLRIDGVGATPVVVFSYGAHPTVLPGSSRMYSGDWVGAARTELLRTGYRALFLPGPLGDQAPGTDDGTEPRSRLLEVGAGVAEVASGLARSLPPGSDLPLLDARERWVEPPAPELRRFCALWWLAPFTAPAIARFVSTRVPFQRLEIGAATLIALPAEPGAALGEQIRAPLRARARFVIAHANDWLGYAVVRSEFERGGYEPCLSLHGAGFGAWLAEQARAVKADR
jgi:hypothetical protein